MINWIRVQSFPYPQDAYLLKAIIELEGIDNFTTKIPLFGKPIVEMRTGFTGFIQ